MIWYEVLLQCQVLVGFISGIIGVLIGYFGRWYIVDKQGLRLAHEHRLIEEHTKRFHEYVELYYVKSISRARLLAESLDKIVERKTLKSKASEEELEFSFFDLARFQSMLYQWGKKGGNIIMLRDSTAEVLIRALYAKAHSQLVSSNGLVTLEDEAILRKEIAPDELFIDFKNKLEKEPLKGVFTRYKSRISTEDASLASLIKWLRCYSGLFLFEINTCYKEWYEGKKTIKLTPPNIRMDLQGPLHELVDTEQINPKDANKYLEKIGTPKNFPVWRKNKKN